MNQKFPLKMNVNVSETKFRYQFISATSPLHPGAQDLLSTKTSKVITQFNILFVFMKLSRTEKKAIAKQTAFNKE